MPLKKISPLYFPASAVLVSCGVLFLSLAPKIFALFSRASLSVPNLLPKLVEYDFFPFPFSFPCFRPGDGREVFIKVGLEDRE